MKEYQIEDIRSNKEVMEEITHLEKKIEEQLGKHVALIAYVEENTD
ncbi:hypothetical protein [Anaerobacillus alkaliphilus]|nr:hypothetical protein [Anaerobacillus alkaliphilus]